MVKYSCRLLNQQGGPSLNMIRNLHGHLSIPLENLISEAKLRHLETSKNPAQILDGYFLYALGSIILSMSIMQS